MRVSSLRPGSTLGVYPQRKETPSNHFERIGSDLLATLVQLVSRRKYQLENVAAQVKRAAVGLDHLDDETLDEHLEAVRYALLRDGLKKSHVFRSFAITQEYARRSLNMNAYDVQLLGAWMIVNGNMAEMATGEGKTFTACFAAATAALAGIPVHIITTNEYLAQRDTQDMRPLYEALGLSVTAVLESMGTEEKRAAYRCDVVYCTNKQVAFDYLRDRLVSGNESGRLSLKFSDANTQRQLVLRGLCFAIVDEADSVLIDEARTPLILSKEHQDDSQQKIYEQALALAKQMQNTRDFVQHQGESTIKLTEAGRAWLTEHTQHLEGIWSGRRHREFLVHQALSAEHLFKRDTHYLVRDGKIEIIDKHTGRTMADRSWQKGLHQMIECKEDCAMTGQRETLASISYQRFFKRYLHMAGMSGTLQQVSSEMRAVYQQRVLAVPTHRPCQREEKGFTLYKNSQEKWLAVSQRIEHIHATGQPVLVATASVFDSELVSTFLKKLGFQHQVLNARQDKEEAQIIALAGRLSQITVATSMAGRGTDIKLGPGVVELGGLYVLRTECHEEYRVDRQLSGRCARQGDPGSSETLISLDDRILETFYPLGLRRLLGRLMDKGYTLPSWLCRYLTRLPQYSIGKRYRAERNDVMRRDEELSNILAYTGRQE